MTSVVILSFNTLALTRKCIQAVLNSSAPAEIIVIDNASSDGSPEMIQKEFPRVKLIQNEKNVGFARGCNQGMEVATGNTILLLNSDAFVFPDTIGVLAQFLETHPKVGLCGPKLLYNDGLLQPSWGHFPTPRRVMQMMLFVDNFPGVREIIDSIHVRSSKRYRTSQQVDWVTGACVMLRKDLFSTVGGIDEKYFMYGEEMEWMYRIAKSGQEIWYVADTECVHLEGGSSADRSVAVVGEMKGWLYWFSKHGTPLSVKSVAAAALVGCWLRMILKRSAAKAYSQAASQIGREVFGL